MIAPRKAWHLGLGPVVLLVMLFVCALCPGWNGSGTDPDGGSSTWTRAGATYRGFLEGEGEGNMVLAGCRPYGLSFTFQNTPSISLRYINISVEAPTSIPTISYSVDRDEAKVIGDVRMSIGPMTVDMNSTLLFEIELDVLFHLNWSEETNIDLVPYLDYGLGPQRVTAEKEVSLIVWGVLDRPIIGRITDGSDTPIPGKNVRSNSSIRLLNVLFSYWHSTYNLSSYHPMSGEVSPILLDGDDEYPMEEGGLVNFTVQTPDRPQGDWSIGMRVDGIVQAGWKVRVEFWTLELRLDGYGPVFDMITPRSSLKVGQGSVEWEIEVEERPSNLDNLVDGSSINYRTGSSLNWSEWRTAPIVQNGRTVRIAGSSVFRIDGDDRIQFRAMDILGNLAESMVFDINLNRPPILTVPADLVNLSIFRDEMLELDGTNFTQDPDDDVEDLIYEWSFDGAKISTGKRFSKQLFAETPGFHTVELKVSDQLEVSELTFEINVVEPPEPPAPSFCERIGDFLGDERVMIIGIPVLFSIIVIVIAVIVIVLVRRMGRSEEDDSDFVISEDASRQNEEIARRIKEMYSGGFTMVGPDGEADAQEDFSGEEFDFDYNLYEVLGVDQNAPEERIKKSYRKLAAYYHPDMVNMHKEIDPEEAKERMVQINKAKEFLLNPERKERYDAHLKEIDFSIDL